MGCPPGDDIYLVVIETLLLSSPVTKPLVPKPHRPIPNPVQPSSKTQLVRRGLGLTLKSWGPPPTPPYSWLGHAYRHITFLAGWVTPKHGWATSKHGWVTPKYSPIVNLVVVLKPHFGLDLIDHGQVSPVFK